MTRFRVIAAAIAAVACVGLVGSPGASAEMVDDAETVDEIVNSTDYSEADADTLRLYRAFLNRDPDDLGSRYWLQQARNGSNPDDLAYGFAQSTEFIRSYGTLTNQEFLDVLYDNMLGRQPDQSGFDYWLGKMNSAELSQHGVVRWIVANDEFEQRFPFEPATTRSERALNFFRATESICATHADQTGNPVPESARFDLATVESVAAWPLAVIEDGRGDSLIVDFSGPTVVIYSAQSGSDGELPLTYSFGCPPELYLGTLGS